MFGPLFDLTGFDWFALICILMAAVIGGYFPLIRRDLVKGEGFPLGQAFSAGVFLALSLIIMLPNGSHLFKKALPHVGYPLASVAALVAYLTLLALGHAGNAERSAAVREDLLTTPLIPVIMTVMIAIPSFLLGTALGISDTSAALVIFVAIMLHKGSAGFALALAMARSTMTPMQSFALYGLFACSTPLGIILGADVHEYLTGHAMILVKATILSLASGVFFYMGTLHEMKHAPLIIHCCTVRGFVTMLAGLGLTALVRLMVGLAHTGHPG